MPSPTSEPLFHLDGVTRRFGEVVALDRVSLDIPRGSVTALIGPSGCGKSTLLRLMLGLLAPDEGRVSFDGIDPGGPDARAVRRRVGFVIQTGGLFPHLTARENVQLPARMAGVAGPARRERAETLAELVRFDADLFDRHPSELSGGQRQRVALMRALMLDPEALLMDEPLGALDPVVRSEVQTEFSELFERLRKTVVIVTHDLLEAARLAPEDIVLMDHGVIRQRGAFTALVRDPVDDFARSFVGAQVDALRRVDDLLAGNA